MSVRPTRTTQTASHWGVYRVETDVGTGEVVSTTGVPFDPDPSPIQASLPAVVRDRLRIDQPYVREGYLRGRGARRADRGREGFVPVSWDKALELVCEALLETRERLGNESIYGGSYGWASAGRLHHAPSVLKRFLGLFGGYTDKSGNHSFGAAMGIMPYVLGRADISNLVVRWPEVVANTRLLVLFGGAALKNTQIDAGGAVNHDNADWFQAARAAGVEIVCVSPSRQDVTGSAAPEWIPIRPNTDLALLLGLAGTLVAHDLVDREFVARWCAGYAEFEHYLTGQADGQRKDAHWASRITGVPADTIDRLARRMAATRTLVNTSWSVQRADHGEQPVWATVALAGLLGQIGLPGGGFSLGFGATSGINLDRPAGIPRPTLPLGTNPVSTRIPVGRVSDLLLNPGGTLPHNGETVRLPQIEVVYSAGGNPFHHNLNINRFLAAWQRPGTVIVHEPWWTPPARYADIVLPSTTTLERNDIQAADHSRFWIAMHQAMPPYRLARNDLDVFGELADRLGFGPDYHAGRDEMQWLRHMYDEASALATERGFTPPGFDEFWAAGKYEFTDEREHPVLLGDFRADPEANPLNTPSGRIELVSETIRSYRYEDCPAHPTWLEPAEWLGGPTAARYPLHLLSNQPAHRLHSQLDNAPLSRTAKVADREPILLNAEDAERRGLREGDVVRVFNDRGAFLAGVLIAGSDTLLPGVAQIATGAWYDPVTPGVPDALEKHGNPNVVTLDKGTSQLAQGSAAQTCLVEVERYDNPPPVTAFDPPPMKNPAPAT
ncbi:molybdopterin-dependent oxidoreductase [Amycolatopsis anabasis]|uniref:molybdopterin-dependent oxidoreductase n=1 Tax=Amycolatopsis anabasis TaxID=1840409 RepID=UPI00131B5027|nr:molybdopterin-dependent oxidoreductase [Amycolatopsis anabasis]